MFSRFIGRFAVVFACLLVPLTALAGSALTPHVAEYKVRISVLGGSLKTRFEATEHGYYAESVISATGMSRLIARGTINEKSWFAVRDGNVLPIQYRSADTISSDHDIVDLDFNWREQEITGFINGEDFHAPLDGEVHDRVSLQYGLMYDLLNGGEKQKYLLQDADELKPLTIANVGMKTVEVPYGEFSALGIQHQREGSSRVTTLWCAEELGWLPVIIEQHRNGKLRLRAILADYQPIEGPLSSSAE